MSLQSFQAALAHVIRGYDANKSRTIDEVAPFYDLTADERATLDQVINQRRLRAYSEDLFMARWTIIREALLFLQPFLKFLDLTELWEHDFEAKSQHVTYEELALRFTDYLVNDPKGLAFISTNTEPFVASLVKYVNMVFTFRHNVLPTNAVSPQSSLTDRYFAILKLDYDVREYFAELMELDDAHDASMPPPLPRPVTLLFVADDEVCEFRSFEIDDEVTQFLQSELEGKHAQSSERPSCFDDLVEIGICKGTRAIKHACCGNH